MQDEAESMFSRANVMLNQSHTNRSNNVPQAATAMVVSPALAFQRLAAIAMSVECRDGDVVGGAKSAGLLKGCRRSGSCCG